MMLHYVSFQLKNHRRTEAALNKVQLPTVRSEHTALLLVLRSVHLALRIVRIDKIEIPWRRARGECFLLARLVLQCSL